MLEKLGFGVSLSAEFHAVRTVATLEERHGVLPCLLRVFRLLGEQACLQAGKLLSRIDGATFCFLLPLLICIEP